jgi:hypothetical protein
MAIIECVKPGAKAGQIILAVDLSIAGKSDEVLAKIQSLGYQPEIRHVAYPSGIHVLAILKDEEFPTTVEDDYLIEEWQQVREAISPDAVHLWRGKS